MQGRKSREQGSSRVNSGTVRFGWKWRGLALAAALVIPQSYSPAWGDEKPDAPAAAQPAAQPDAPAAQPVAQPAEGQPQPPADNNPGLQGILPEDVPAGIDFEAFAELGGNWEQWGEETGELVTKLYEPEQPLGAAEQREILEALQAKLRVMEQAMSDPRYRSIYDKLISLHGRLKRRVELATAALDVLEMDPMVGREEVVGNAHQNLLESADALQQYLNRVPNGAAWIEPLGLNAVTDMLRTGAPPEELVPELERLGQILARKDQIEGEQQRAFLARPPFGRVESALNQYLILANAPEGDGLKQALREQLVRLVDAAEAYESNNAGGAVEALKDTLAAIEALSPGAARRIEPVLRTYYFNYNMQLLVSESFLARYVSDSNCRFEAICDYIMGARVTGSSRSQTHVTFDMRPSAVNAKFDINLIGSAHTNTQAETNFATVYAVGNNYFNASKSAYFDGERFATRPAVVNANPNTRIVDAETVVDWIPIIGGIARRAALREANRRRGQSEAIAAGRIISRVGSELDREVNQNFANATHDLETGMFRRLRNTGLYPAHTRTSSSDLYMRISSLIRNPGEPAGGVPSPTYPPGRGLTINLHESLLNNTFNRLNFNGRRMTDTEVRQELEAFMEELLGRDVDLSNNTPADPQADEGPNVYIFQEQDPLRVQIDDGTVYLIIRAAFEQDDGSVIPPQVVTVPLTPRLGERELYFDRGPVRVAPVDKPENLAEQIARAGIIRKKIESDFQDMNRDRKIVFERDNEPGIVTYIMRVKALNEWLTIWVE